MAQHDNYDKDVLKALQRIASSLEKIEKKMSKNYTYPNHCVEKIEIGEPIKED